MFERLNETILNVVNNEINNSVCDFENWYLDDFETEYEFEDKDDLERYSPEDIENIKSDWIDWVSGGFVIDVLSELGIQCCGETDSNSILIGEIRKIVNMELRKRLS